MRFTSKGIGWLIAGGIICAAAVGDDSLASAAGTALFGLVFIAVYFIKQYFDPAGIGWFIAGGILLAFSAETMLGVTGGILKGSFLDRDSLSDVLIALVIAAGCLFAFYKRNQREVDDLAADMGVDMDMMRPAHAPEAAEPVQGSSEPAAEEAVPEIEFEMETKDGTKK